MNTYDPFVTITRENFTKWLFHLTGLCEKPNKYYYCQSQNVWSTGSGLDGTHSLTWECKLGSQKLWGQGFVAHIGILSPCQNSHFFQVFKNEKKNIFFRWLGQKLKSFLLPRKELSNYFRKGTISLLKWWKMRFTLCTGGLLYMPVANGSPSPHLLLK